MQPCVAASKYFMMPLNFSQGPIIQQQTCSFSKFCEINLKIIEWLKSNDKFVVSMAKSMKEKFDKY